MGTVFFTFHIWRWILSCFHQNESAFYVFIESNWFFLRLCFRLDEYKKLRTKVLSYEPRKEVKVKKKKPHNKSKYNIPRNSLLQYIAQLDERIPDISKIDDNELLNKLTEIVSPGPPAVSKLVKILRIKKSPRKAGTKHLIVIEENNKIIRKPRF